MDPSFDESLMAAKKHFEETGASYKQQYLVNLIDKKGSQKMIGQKFTEIYQSLKDPNLHYVWFDFHGECKNMKWENLSRLVNIVKKELDEWGHFVVDLDVGLD